MAHAIHPFRYAINFRTILLKNGTRHSLIHLPRHPSPLAEEARCVMPNECDILTSCQPQIGSKYSCNTILLGTSQIVLETLLQIPITIHLPVKITEYVYLKFWAISIFILILLKDLSPRAMIQMIFLYYLVQIPLVLIEYLCVPGTVLSVFI